MIKMNWANVFDSAIFLLKEPMSGCLTAASNAATVSRKALLDIALMRWDLAWRIPISFLTLPWAVKELTKVKEFTAGYCVKSGNQASRYRMVFCYHSRRDSEYHFWGRSIALRPE
jgi:hypothetical protein